MPTIDKEISIERGPEEVWALVGDLAAVTRWVPGVAAVRMEGMRRVCKLEEGGEIQEQISDFSDSERRYRYEQDVHPLGFKRSVGTLAVEPNGEGSRLVWHAEIEFGDPSQEPRFLPMLEQGYAEALRRLKEAVER